VETSQSQSSNKEWAAHVLAYRASGQSASEWCASHGVNFYQFRSRLRYFPIKRPASSTPSSSKWLSVQVGESNARSSIPLVVRIGHAAIEVQTGYDPSLLSDVVRTLSALC